MTTSDIGPMLAAADLDDVTTRLVLADALEDAGRPEESALARGDGPVMLHEGSLVASVTYEVELRSECGAVERREVTVPDDEDGGNEAATDEARELLEAWLADGDWHGDDPGATVEVQGEYALLDGDGDEIAGGQITVEVEPDHERLIRRAGGDPSCEHEWEGVGGLDSNPGVFSLGGTAVRTVEQCRCCGLIRRETSYGSQRNPGDPVSRVEYEQPEGWGEEGGDDE